MSIPADWRNPTPTLAESGIDADALARLAGDRLLLFSLPARDIEAPVRGTLRRYERVTFRGSAVVVPASAEKIRARLLDFAGYVTLIPNTTRAQILQHADMRTQAEYVHTFHLSMMTIHTRLRLQHVREADGSLSAWLMDGDADAAVSRWEIVPLGRDRSLIVYFNWADIASTNLVLQMLLKAQPDLALAAPYGAAFVAMDAMRSAFTPATPAPAACPEQPVVPAFPRVQEHPLLATLAASGPLALVDEGQWVRRDDETYRQRFVAVGSHVDAPLSSAYQHSIRFERYPEFLPLVLKATNKGKGEQLSVDWSYGIGLGFFSMGVQYRLGYQQVGPSTLRFRREAGDIAWIDGEWDWQQLDANRCLGAMTIGYRIGPQPPLVLRFARHLPHHDVIGGLYIGLTSMQRLGDWLPRQHAAGTAP